MPLAPRSSIANDGGMNQILAPQRTGPSRNQAAQPKNGLSGIERALIWLEGLLAVGAYAGAIGMITGGVDFGEAAARLPFQSMVLAGWALALVNGLLPTLVVIGVLQRRAWSGYGHITAGAGLIAWIVVQVSVLGPPIHWLQLLYFTWGVAILTLGWRLQSDVGGRRPKAGLIRGTRSTVNPSGRRARKTV
jgi:hypothetical protein